MDQLSAGGIAILATAALLAGAINAVAGGGSLITFPTLLALGFAPITANVTNTVGLVPGYLGGIAGYRRELTGQKRTIKMLLPAAFTGAVVGAAILLTTSGDIFRILVPALVLIASLLLLFQPALQSRLTKLHPESGEAVFERHDVAAIAGIFVAAVYGGYFGGVLGVIVLAMLGITMVDSLQRLNALKSVLQFLINGVAVVIFAIWGPVQWGVVAVMAPLTLVGGWLGSHFGRKLQPTYLRWIVGMYGIACAVVLALTLR
ncbi:MAG: sulfite exporter TauE/SafE family protein [Acidimicrobiales bacterium]